MLQYFKFNLNAISFVEASQDKTGTLSIRWTSKDMEHYLDDPDWIKVNPAALKNPALWLYRLEGLHIYRWARTYEPPLGFDGLSWDLTYKEYGKLKKYSHGRQMFPDAWSSLMMLLDELGTDIDYMRFRQPNPPRSGLFHRSFTYGDLKSSLDRSYLVQGSVKGRQIISPELYKSTQALLQELGLGNEAKKDELYSLLWHGGHSLASIEKIEWCFPAPDRDFLGLEKKFSG